MPYYNNYNNFNKTINIIEIYADSINDLNIKVNLKVSSLKDKYLLLSCNINNAGNQYIAYLTFSEK